jgi:hypothetical protein
MVKRLLLFFSRAFVSPEKPPPRALRGCDCLVPTAVAVTIPRHFVDGFIPLWSWSAGNLPLDDDITRHAASVSLASVVTAHAAGYRFCETEAGPGSHWLSNLQGTPNEAGYTTLATRPGSTVTAVVPM